MTTANVLDRQFFLDVDAAGYVSIRERGSKDKRRGLPVFSTDTREQAKALIVRHCRLARDGSGLYRLNDPPKDVDDLGRITELFRETYEEPAR